MLKLEIGGNTSLLDYFTYYKINKESIRVKYYSKAAEFYQEKLMQIAENPNY